MKTLKIRSTFLYVAIFSFLIFCVLNYRNSFGENNIINFTLLLGKSIKNNEVKNFMDNMKEKPLVSDLKGLLNACHYLYKKNGLELYFFKDKLLRISLFSKDYGEYKQYEREIPLKLSFNDTRLEVHNKISAPQSITGNVKELLWEKWVFTDYILQIQYNNEKISIISFFKN
jgi:hypothetical protein